MPLVEDWEQMTFGNSHGATERAIHFCRRTEMSI